jgi:Na+/phosphate symporter
MLYISTHTTILNSILLVITGLILFLYAFNNLFEGLREISGDKLKAFLDRLPITHLKAFFPVTL